MKKYSEILKELREDRDLTQQNLADILKTERSYYGKYERGIRPLPIEHLITLCKFYNVSADYILGLPEGLKFPKK
ncbi:MAG: helix-turn-helix transcriptional regulator [Clostridia bacterium]|nr:helix-turn-helix transcriptional regulator [Clostridia bacterium]